MLAQVLSRWRWAILLIGISCVLVVEALEHREVTAQFVFEVAFYGLVIVASTTWLLTLLARQTTRQAQLEESLESQREFSQQLARYQTREELIEFITHFPGANMPVDRVTLFQYDHLKTQLEFAAEWCVDAQVRLPTRYVPRPPNVDYVRKLCTSAGLHAAKTCPLVDSSTNSLGGQHFCLPLGHDSILVGLLRLRCQPKEFLSTAQIEFLNSISAQVALALALSIAFPRQLTEVQRAERRRLGYELHDSLAQQIGYLHLGLDRLADDDRLGNAAWLRSELDRLRQVANASYLQVRKNLSLLQNQDEVDLVQAVENYIRSIAPQVSYKIAFSTSGVPLPMGPLTSRQIFGLIQESLNNAQKHAQAQLVQVVLQWYTERLDITVTDNGVGFDLTSLPEDGHYGLTMLQDRTHELRGEIRITSAPGAGTSLQFEIPLRT